VRVLITGVTGLIGSRLALVLHHHGHEVTGLARDPLRARREVPVLANVWPWNPMAAAPDPEAFEGVQAVVHLAGKPIAGRWTRARKEAIRSSRILGTRHLIEGIPRDGTVRVLFCASATGYYGDRGDQELTEHAPPGRGFIPDLVRDWEAESRAAVDRGVRVVTGRFGIVLWRRGGALPVLARAARMGLAGRIGTGEQWWPWVHLEDVVGFIERAIRDDTIRGVFNLVSPHLVRQAEFVETLAGVLRRPMFLGTPAWLVRFALGEGGLELLKSQRVVPRRTLDSGFRFRYESLPFALGDALTR